jgi:uncharacterized protein YjiS (DUF1127 family)
MTTLDLYEASGVAEKRPAILAGLKRLWAGFGRRREERMTLNALSRLDPYLLRDIGIEPLDVYDALSGRRRSILFSPIRRYTHSE